MAALVDESSKLLVNNKDDDDDDYEEEYEDDEYPREPKGAQRTLRRFTVFSFIVTANPCAAVACLTLATARLGEIGAWSSGMLYLSYTMSSVLGSTYVVKRMGGRDAMIIGMSLFVVYVACFWVAVSYPTIKGISAIGGAFIGGIGSGILWTAQGSYFTQATEEYALYNGCEWADCTATFSGTFAFAYLLEETILHVSSYIFLEYWEMEWSTIFAIYAAIAVVSTIGMLWVTNYPKSRPRRPGKDATDDSFATEWYKVTAAINLLLHDPKMKYLVGLCAVFGFSASFVNSFVSGEAIRIALDDTQSKTVGVFVSWSAGVASISSLAFGKLTHDYGKTPTMVFGNIIHLGVVVPFMIQPDLKQWTWPLLAFVYACHGIGRATFESAMKATFADFFPYEKEGAFANIILQNGIFSSIGYILTFRLVCSPQGRYCIEYNNGTLHNVLIFELLVCFAVVAAVLGYWKASSIYWEERLAKDSEIKEYRRESINAYRRSRGSSIKSSGLDPSLIEYLALEDD